MFHQLQFNLLAEPSPRTGIGSFAMATSRKRKALPPVACSENHKPKCLKQLKDWLWVGVCCRRSGQLPKKRSGAPKPTSAAFTAIRALAAFSPPPAGHPRSTSEAAAGFASRRRGRASGLAGAADDKLTLQLALVVLIRGLVFFPLVLRLNLIGSLGRRSAEWAEDDFFLRPRMLPGRRINRLHVVRRSRAEAVPRGRRRGRYRSTTVSQRTTIGERQRGKDQYSAFRNHRDHLNSVAIKKVTRRSSTRAFSASMESKLCSRSLI